MGRSGSGKTVFAKSISGLLLGTPGIIEGKILLHNNNLLEGLPKAFSRSKINGSGISQRQVNKWKERIKANHLKYARNRFAYIFQNPWDALNPYFTIDHHLKEAFHTGGMKSGDRKKHACELLNRLNFNTPEHILNKYPHQISGGEAQRIGVAMALAQRASIIIADECTTSLDPTAAIGTLEALQHARNAADCSIIFITHDEELAKAYSDRILMFEDGMLN
jgi:ABC-type glutathione transport system ATPase component